MQKLLPNTKGFGLIAVLAIVVVVAGLGSAGAYVYHQNHKTKSPATTSTTTKSSDTKPVTTTPAEQAKNAAMATWKTFSNSTVGLSFRYPSNWNQPTFTPMNATPSNSAGTFYKISFGNSTYMTVNPTASVDESTTTFGNLQTDNVQYASSRHVFISEPTVIGDIVPSVGNQDAEIYAARSLKLPKVDASDVVLFDSRSYGGACSQASYVSCYTTTELNDYQWLLESASSI